MASRLIQVCDAAAARLRLLWSPAPPAAVARAYLPNLAEGPKGRWPEGRQVYVFPVGLAQVERLARAGPGADLRGYTVAFVVAEKYDQAGQPPDAWVDERVEWLERVIFGDLADPEQEPILDALWPHTAEIVKAYDEDLLRFTPAGFCGEVQIEFREGYPP